MSTPKFRVAICGGGVGGLVLAVALSRYPDIRVDVYESSTSFTEPGAGVGLWPRTWKIMEALDLERDLKKVAIVPPGKVPNVSFTFRKADQPIGISFHQLTKPGEVYSSFIDRTPSDGSEGMLSFHRPDFLNVLQQHLSDSSCRTHSSKRLVSYRYEQQTSPSRRRSHHPPIILQFHDGTTAQCDLLIGADGIQSAVRACMLREAAGKSRANGKVQEANELLSGIEPRWSGMTMYRTTISSEALNRKLSRHRVLHEPMVYVGTNTQVTAYPVARGTQVSVAVTRVQLDLENTQIDGPWIQTSSREDLIHEFDRWEPEVQAIIQSVQSMSRWAIHTSPQLRSYVSGRVGLIGDAAHAMLPYESVGSGQAIEDAHLLATLLGHPSTTIDTLTRALETYDRVRRPFTQMVGEGSKENALLYTLNYPSLRFDEPERHDEKRLQRLSEVCHRIKKNWEWVWNTTLEGDIDRALGMLESRR